MALHRFGSGPSVAATVGRKRMDPQKRREAMLRVGIELFGSKPYDNVSVDDICNQSGVSRPLLQHYFGSKQQFFNEVIAAAMTELERTTRPSKEGNDFDQLEALLVAYFTFMATHPLAISIVLNQRQSGANSLELFDDYRNRTFLRIARGLGEDRITAPVAAAIRCWIGLNETLAAQLLRSEQLTVEWAAQYSSSVLFQLIASADRNNG